MMSRDQEDFVPSQNSSDNIAVADVVGNKTDTIAGSSLVSAALKSADIYSGGVTHFWVDGSLGASGGGYLPSDAFQTLTEAVATAAAGDVIHVKGEPTEPDTVTIDKELIIIGENESDNVYKTMFYNTGDYPILTVKANNCVIKNIGFVQNHANPAIQIGDTAGQAYYKLIIDNCKFDLFATGTYAIAGGDTADAPDITITNNLFRSFATAAILSNFTRALIKGNRFIVPTALAAIVHSPDTSSRPDTHILDNVFVTGDGTNAVGITVSNTPDAGTLLVDGNHFIGFADDAHVCSKRTGYMGLNYGGVTAITITT
jgi:hypothetical protein